MRRLGVKVDRDSVTTIEGSELNQEHKTESKIRSVDDWTITTVQNMFKAAEKALNV